jgi:hypothetical protein
LQLQLAACKRLVPPVVVPLLASAKKQAVEQPKNVVTGVVTQAVSLDSKLVERVAVVVTMPGNITNKSQISVEFVAGSNGAKVNVYVPRGKLANNMDRLKKGIAGLSGLDLMDAAHITRPLETKLIYQQENIDELIVDVIGITLDKACNPQKKAWLRCSRHRMATLLLSFCLKCRRRKTTVSGTKTTATQ